jgi:hypothetical protein
MLPVFLGGVDSRWHNALQAVERICLFNAIILLEDTSMTLSQIYLALLKDGGK